MKALVTLLLAAALAMLWWPRSGPENPPQDITSSSRRVLDAQWRSQNDREMTIADMERYAASLSDEELWRQLGLSCDDWLAENEGREWFYQPRLPVMLAREIGKREGLEGLERVTEYCDQLKVRLTVAGDLESRKMLEFFDVRLRLATFAGWVSEQPKAAILRLCQAYDREDIDIPIQTPGPLLYYLVDEHVGVGRILRDGFARLNREDFDLANELLHVGLDAEAFDGNAVVESLLEGIEPEEQERRIKAIVGVSDWQEIIDFDPSTKDVSQLTGSWSFLDLSFWVHPDAPFEEKVGGFEALFRMVRLRAQESLSFMVNESRSQEDREEVAAIFLLKVPDSIGVLDSFTREARERIMERVCEAEQEWHFGPILGREEPGAENVARLRAELEE